MSAMPSRLSALALCLCAALWGCDDEGTSADPTADAEMAPDAELTADAGVTPDAEMTPDAEPDPEPIDFTAPGASRVGFMEDEVIYTPPRQAEPRSLRMVAWYPTEAETGESTRYAGLLRADNVLGDAPPALAEGAPVMLFSHGNSGLAEQSYFLAEFMASHGWLVVAFDHTGNTFNNNDLEIYTLFELRPLDVSAVLDHLTDLPAEHPLAGAVGDEVLLAGHSFGGYTTLAVAGAGFDVDSLIAGCAEAGDDFCDYMDEAESAYRAGFGDDRVVAALPMTPVGATIFAAGLADIDIPLLMMTGGKDATLPDPQEGDPIWMAMDGPDATRAAFPDAGHFTFTNICDISPALAADDGCGDAFIPPVEAHALINAYALAFGRLYMLGDPAGLPLLTGEVALDDEAVEIFTQP